MGQESASITNGFVPGREGNECCAGADGQGALRLRRARQAAE